MLYWPPKPVHGDVVARDEAEELVEHAIAVGLEDPAEHHAGDGDRKNLGQVIGGAQKAGEFAAKAPADHVEQCGSHHQTHQRRHDHHGDDHQEDVHERLQEGVVVEQRDPVVQAGEVFVGAAAAPVEEAEAQVADDRVEDHHAHEDRAGNEVEPVAPLATPALGDARHLVRAGSAPQRASQR